MTLEEAQARILELEAEATARATALEQATTRNVELEQEITRVREFNNKLFLQVSQQAGEEEPETEPEPEKTIAEALAAANITL